MRMANGELVARRTGYGMYVVDIPNEAGTYRIRCEGVSEGEDPAITRAAPAPEPFPDRVLRVAREAGYEPTGAWEDPAWGGSVFVRFENQTVVRVFADADLAPQLRKYAGPDNQPEAVRARKEAADYEATGLGAARDFRESVMARLTALHSLGDMVEVARGACAAAGAELTHVESRGTTLFVLIRGDYGKTLRVEELVRAAMPAWAEVRVLFNRPRDATGAVHPCVRDAMISAILARQVAAGGVDTEGTRAEAERWCAMLAGCVCEGMRATTDRGCESGPGIVVNKTPGPHEGATAWASATWEEL